MKLNRRLSCALMLLVMCVGLTAFGALLQVLNIVPDQAERTQTAEGNLSTQIAAANATRGAELTATMNTHPTTLPATNTNEPTNTAVAVPTSIPTATNTSVPTFTLTALITALATNPPATFTFTPEAARVEEMPPTTYYVQNQANLRACADTACAIVVTLNSGATITVNGRVVGQPVEANNNIWYRTNYNGREAYVYSSLVDTTAPAQNPQVVNTTAPSGVACPGFQYTCEQLTCAQAYACLAAGNTDLDGNHDTIPCNEQCR